MALVVHNATLIDGTERDPIDHAAVVIEGPRILAAGAEATISRPADARLLDADGGTIIPGLLNLHDHISRKGLRVPATGLSFRDEGARLMGQSSDFLALLSARNVLAELRSGVTTIRDFGLAGSSPFAVRRAIDEGVIPGPRLRVAGQPVCITGGHAHQWSREADGPDEVRKAVREQLRAGADCVKLMASAGLIGFPDENPEAPEFTIEELRAGVEEAHNAHKRAAAHAYPTEAIRRAVRAGIDSIEHGVYLDEESVEMMRQAEVALVPTISGLVHLAFQFQSIEEDALYQEVMNRVIAPQQQSIRMAAEADLRIGTGSDTAGELVEELELIQDAAGFSNLACIRAATRVSAEIAGLERRLGTLEPGKFADLVVVQGQPHERLGDLRRPRWVIRDGRVFDGEPMALGVRMRALSQRGE
jgi:imidazolonepropionase-like amidohydrolase